MYGRFIICIKCTYIYMHTYGHIYVDFNLTIYVKIEKKFSTVGVYKHIV